MAQSFARSRRVTSTAEQEKEGFWKREEKEERHQWETVVRALTRTRTPLAETEGASLSQQIRVGGGKKCPEHSSESGFLVDGKEQGQTLRGTFT